MIKCLEQRDIITTGVEMMKMKDKITKMENINWHALLVITPLCMMHCASDNYKGYIVKSHRTKLLFSALFSLFYLYNNFIHVKSREGVCARLLLNNQRTSSQ